MHVREIMSKDVVCCTRTTSIPDVARMMVQHDCGSLPVVDKAGDRQVLVGMITDRDIVVRMIAQNRDPMQLTVGDCMSPRVIAVSPEDDVEAAADVMREYQVRRVPVQDANGACCGMVAQADLAEKTSKDTVASVVREVSQPA
jgi:CBS domain-containing protein